MLNHWEPNIFWNTLFFVTSVEWSSTNQVCNFVVKNWLCPDFIFRFPESFQFFKLKPSFKRIIMNSIYMLQTKNFAQDIFAPTAEAKKAG